MEKEKSKPYEAPPQKPVTIAEPVVAYGAIHLNTSMRYTYADYLTWLDEKRRELIDGFIHLMSAPVRRHANVSMTLSLLIGSFIKKKRGQCRIYHAPFDVRLPIHGSTDDDKVYDVVQPDICVICDLTKLDDKGCIGAPDLVVEVLSPSSLMYDCHYKFDLYEKAGVREYWIVNPKEKTIHVFLLKPDGTFDKGTIFESGQKAPVSIFDGLTVDLDELFED